jgi:hypothetical protein
MKILLIIGSSLIFMYQNIGQAQSQDLWLKDSVQLKAKAARLQKYYAKAVQGPDTVKYQKLFFEEFPANFRGLERLYGYQDTACILYEKADEHIYTLFNHLVCVPPKAYYEKIIDLAIGGKWDADGISEFQHGLHEHFIKDPAFAFGLLQRKSDNDIESFWVFYFDGPHPPDKAPDELDGMKTSFPRVHKIMQTALKKVQKAWENE